VVDDGDGNGQLHVRRVSELPHSHEAGVIVRTDFSSGDTWAAVMYAVTAPSDEGFLAYVQPVDDPAYRGLTADQLLALASGSYLFVADTVTMTHPEHPLLVVDLRAEPGRQFRATPAAIQGIQNNLSISNMDFFEFADAAGSDGIFRGF
jgi:hypothetical protein